MSYFLLLCVSLNVFICDESVIRKPHARILVFYFSTSVAFHSCSDQCDEYNCFCFPSSMTDETFSGGGEKGANSPGRESPCLSHETLRPERSYCKIQILVLHASDA